jgi:hypothetical protein
MQKLLRFKVNEARSIAKGSVTSNRAKAFFRQTNGETWKRKKAILLRHGREHSHAFQITPLTVVYFLEVEAG